MRNWIAVIAVALTLAACSKPERNEAKDKVQDAATRVAETVTDAVDVAVPIGRDDPAQREKERFNEEWRNLETFRAQQAMRAQAARAAANAQVQFAPNAKESFEGITPDRIDAAPVAVPLKGDVAGPSVLKTQVLLDRLNFSVGALDGRWGRNTAIALWWYQRSRGISAQEPGALDEATFRSLASEAALPKVVVQRTLSAADVEGPFVSIPDDVYDQEKLDCLCYESKGEKLAELFHTTREFLEKLNQGVELDSLNAGDRLWVPNVRQDNPSPKPDIAKVVISIRGNTFNAFDAAGNLILHAPTTLGSKYDPSPSETVEVVKTTFDPHFHYQPKLFHEVPDENPEANLSPGPNSPVGVVWIALSKPHYGIHGTSDPDSIGYASSHGCVRLTNWDAREVGHRISKGVQVEFVDTATKG